MKFILALLLLQSNVFASTLPKDLRDVQIILEKEEPTYANIPMISKVFEGARNQTDTTKIDRECREWIMNEVTNNSAPLYRVYCIRQKDVISRQYNYIGKVLIKSWK